MITIDWLHLDREGIIMLHRFLQGRLILQVWFVTEFNFLYPNKTLRSGSYGGAQAPQAPPLNPPMFYK